MASVVTDNTTSGFVDVKTGVFGGVVAVTDNLLTDTNLPVVNRLGMDLLVYRCIDVANAETITFSRPDIVALAWQPEDATDDDVRAALTTQATGVVTFVAGGTRQGWLWMLVGANASR